MVTLVDFVTTETPFSEWRGGFGRKRPLKVVVFTHWRNLGKVIEHDEAIQKIFWIGTINELSRVWEFSE